MSDEEDVRIEPMLQRDATKHRDCLHVHGERCERPLVLRAQGVQRHHRRLQHTELWSNHRRLQQRHRLQQTTHLDNR